MNRINQHKRSAVKPLTFRRWSGKGYASFVSMKREVRIGVLSLGCTLLSLPGATSFARTSDTLRTVTLREAEVNESRIELQSHMSGSIEVVPHEVIAAAPVRSLPELLRFVSGVDVRERGTETQADLSIRGGTFDQMLVSLNGINLSDPQTGHYALDLPISLSEIDHIEILRGPDARLMGPNAFAGVINIVTASEKTSPESPVGSSEGKGSDLDARLSYRGGDHGLSNPSGSLTIRTPKTTMLTALDYSHCDGYRANTDYDLVNAFAQVRHQSGVLGNMNMQAGFQQKSYGALRFYSLKYPDQYERTNTSFVSLSTTRKMGPVVLSPSVAWREHLDRFDLFRNASNAASWYSGANFHQTDVVTTGLRASLFSKIGRTSFGGEFRFEHIRSNVLGEATSSHKVWFTNDESYFTHHKTRRNLHLYVDQSLRLHRLSVAFGGALELSSDFRPDFTYGADATLEVSRVLKAYASLGRALRYPTFTDLYYSSADHLSNPSLGPETSLSVECGLRMENQRIGSPDLRLSGSLAAFHRHGKNLIDWVRRPEEERWRCLNHTSLNATGLNAVISLQGTAPHLYLRDARLSYDLVHLDKDSDGLLSQYALDYLRQRIALTLRHRIIGREDGPMGGLEASWSGSWNQRCGTWTDERATSHDYKPFVLVNLRLAWHRGGESCLLKHLTLYAEAQNLLDRSYVDYGGLRQPGIWPKGGIEMRF